MRVLRVGVAESRDGVTEGETVPLGLVEADAVGLSARVTVVHVRDGVGLWLGLGVGLGAEGVEVVLGVCVRAGVGVRDRVGVGECVGVAVRRREGVADAVRVGGETVAEGLGLPLPLRVGVAEGVELGTAVPLRVSEGVEVWEGEAVTEEQEAEAEEECDRVEVGVRVGTMVAVGVRDGGDRETEWLPDGEKVRVARGVGLFVAVPECVAVGVLRVPVQPLRLAVQDSETEGEAVGLPGLPDREQEEADAEMPEADAETDQKPEPDEVRVGVGVGVRLGGRLAVADEVSEDSVAVAVPWEGVKLRLQVRLWVSDGVTEGVPDREAEVLGVGLREADEGEREGLQAEGVSVALWVKVGLGDPGDSVLVGGGAVRDTEALAVRVERDGDREPGDAEREPEAVVVTVEDCVRVRDPVALCDTDSEGVCVGEAVPVPEAVAGEGDTE